MWCNRNGSVKENSWCRRFYTPTECILGGFCLSRKPVSGWKNLVDSWSITSWLTSPERLFVHSETAPPCNPSQVGDPEQDTHSKITLLMWTSGFMSAVWSYIFIRKWISFWWSCWCCLGHWLTTCMLLIPNTWNWCVQSNASTCGKSNNSKDTCI